MKGPSILTDGLKNEAILYVSNKAALCATCASLFEARGEIGSQPNKKNRLLLFWVTKFILFCYAGIDKLDNHQTWLAVHV